jgi:uncharacterized membrane protein YeaQ/YmgE (transglycosylase-associated protein family)
MGVGSLIVFLIVGALAGWIAGKMVRGRGFGLIGNMVLGILGAVIAGYLLPQLGFTAGGGFFASLLHATLGAVVLLAVVRLVKNA